MGSKKDRVSKAWETYLTDEILLDRFTLSPGIRYTSVEYDYNATKTISQRCFGLEWRNLSI